MDEGKTGLEGGFLVFLCVADIDAFGVAIAVHDQADILALGQAGAPPFLVIQEKIRGTGRGKESLHIACLAVADNRQAIAFFFQGFHGGTEIRIQCAAMGIEVFHFIIAALIKDRFPVGDVYIGVKRLADFLHGHSHDTVDIICCKQGQTGHFALEDFIPGFGYRSGRIPEGAVKVKNQ